MKAGQRGSKVAECEEMLHDNELWGIISQERLKVTHCLGYLRPDQGKMQIQHTLNSNL